eukprot:g50311.t1
MAVLNRVAIRSRPSSQTILISLTMRTIAVGAHLSLQTMAMLTRVAIRSRPSSQTFLISPTMRPSLQTLAMLTRVAIPMLLTRVTIRSRPSSQTFLISLTMRTIAVSAHDSFQYDAETFPAIKALSFFSVHLNLVIAN